MPIKDDDAPEKDDIEEGGQEAPERDDDEDSGKPENLDPHAQEARPSRKERRSQFAAQAAQRRREKEQAYEARIAQFEGTIEEMRRNYEAQMSDFRKQFEGRSKQEEAKSGEEAFKQKAGEVQAAINAELQAMAANANHPTDRYFALLDQKAEMVADRRFDARRKEWEADLDKKYGQRPQERTTSANEVQLKMEFPWLNSNKNAEQATGRYYYTLIAMGREPGIDTQREAAAYIEGQMKLGTGKRRQPNGAWGSMRGGRANEEDEAGEWTDEEKRLMPAALRGKSKAEITKKADRAARGE